MSKAQFNGNTAPMAAQSRQAILISAAPAMFVVLWATGFVVAKLSAGHVAPVWFLTLRFPIACLVMLGFALAQRAVWPTPRGAAHAAIAGAFLHAGYLAPIYWAVANGLPAGVSALIVGIQPVLTTFMAALFLYERVSGKHWLGLVIGLVGIALVIVPKLSFALLGGITPVTASLAAFGAFSVSFGTVYQKKFASTLPLSTGGVWQYVGASIVVFFTSLLLGDFMFDHSWQAWAALGWAVIVLSIVAILLLMLLIRQGEVSRVSSLIFLVPAVASLTTFIFYNETLNAIQLLGMLVSAFAVLVINGFAARPQAAPTK